MVKVMVFGKGEAGKSTFIRSLIPGAVNIEHKGRTVALDYGDIRINGKKIHLFGTPGQARFNVVREVISFKADGAIMIFDGAAGLSRDDTRIIEEIVDLHVPFVSVLNIKTSSRNVLTMGDVERLCRATRLYMRGFEGNITDHRFSLAVLSQFS
ncbi:MAG TPA: GTP-binding protein [Thermodesulfovibrionales bacterium]|nr:GTP-binding protein [Thermodesulfovibrionales bacterium]